MNAISETHLWSPISTKREKLVVEFRVDRCHVTTHLVKCKRILAQSAKLQVFGVISYKLGSAASASAALLPLIPTETPHTKLHSPTVMPAQNKAYPV